MADGIRQALEQNSNQILDYALLLAAVGTISMALIELAKSLFDFRLKFNRWRIKRWLEFGGPQGTYEELVAAATGTVGKPRRAGWFAWLVLGEIEPGDVLFDQPVEKMMAQIQAVANVAMDFPDRYRAIYQFLTVSRETPEAAAGPPDASLWYTFVMERAQPPRAGATLDEAAEAAKSAAAAQARARLANLVARKLDTFQTDTQYRWAELNQRAAVMLGFVVLLAAQYQAATDLTWVTGLRAVLLALLGGLIAPFAKDVVSALSGIAFKRG